MKLFPVIDPRDGHVVADAGTARSAMESLWDSGFDDRRIDGVDLEHTPDGPRWVVSSAYNLREEPDRKAKAR